MEASPMIKFREELAKEILFIIAAHKTYVLGHIPSLDEILQEFENKVGDKLVHLIGIEGHEFLRSSRILSMVWRNPLRNDHHTFGRRYGYDYQYSEMLLIQVCKLVKTDDSCNACCESSGNSVLHYLVGIPGEITPNLVRLLLQTGADPLAVNKKSQNILHVIAGRLRAEKNENGHLVFQDEKVRPWEFKAEDRRAILEVLNDELFSAQLTTLVTRQDKAGDTAMHEWTLAASMVLNINRDEDTDYLRVRKEKEIASLLLKFGALLRLPNHSGHVPLHYAFNTDVFKFLVGHYNVSNVRNDLNETPLMFMIKTIIRKVVSQTWINEHQGLTMYMLGPMRPKPINVKKLTHILDVVEECSTVWDSIWTYDTYGNSIFNIAIDWIKISSLRRIEEKRPSCTNLLLLDVGKIFEDLPLSRLTWDLLSLLRMLMSIGIRDDVVQEQVDNALHTLLDIPTRVTGLEWCERPILDALDILLRHGVNVNAVDCDGLTPLDMAYKHFSRQPHLYQEMIDKLLQHGADRSISQSCKREIKCNCPARHLINATKLAEVKSTERNVTVVGKYRYFNDQPIGSGAFSSIFVALKDEHFNERSDTFYCSAFALKRIEKAKVNPKEISSEVKALISFSNECDQIVKYYGVEDSDDAFFQYLCLELMDGDLEHAVTNSSELRTGDSQMKAVRDIVKGVAYLHECNFIHRDLKPGNILYTTEPNLHFKISDFGLTKNINSFSMMTSTIGSGVAMVPGTRCWMAPELVSMKSREHTKESDLFSLGLVLHYLLTLGEHPFASRSGEPPYAIERRIADMQINIDRELHPEASNFLQCLMAKDPLKRLPTKYINQHPFLWSELKKIEFLKAVGDQPEAVKTGNHSSSALEQRLQKTTVGRMVEHSPWDQGIGVKKLFTEMVKAWKQKRYRTDKVIDFIRFIRNAYAHMQERSSELQDVLDSNIFLGVYPTLVLDVFLVVQDVGFLESRRKIRQVLSTNVDNRT